MSGVRWIGRTSADVQTGTSRKGMYQAIAGANHRALVDYGWISWGNGTDPTATPVLVEIVLQSSAGSGGTTDNPIKENTGDDETLEITGQRGPITGATDVQSLFAEYVIPYDKFEWKPRHDQPVLGGQGIAIYVTSGVDYKVRAGFEGDE